MAAKNLLLPTLLWVVVVSPTPLASNRNHSNLSWGRLGNTYLIVYAQYTGYHYTALTWVMGVHSPQNPTCQKVNVKRVFV